MLNVSRILSHPLIAQTFTVHRSSGQFAAGGWTENAPSSITISGAAYPSTVRDLQAIPEGDRVSGMMTFLSPQPIYLTHAAGTPGTSDQIEWKGEFYRIIQIMDWSDYGYYMGIGARMMGN